MDFEPTDDQIALRDELRRFLDARVTPEARRAVIDLPGAVDRDLWRELGGMGVFALTLPEDAGGVGLGLAEATLVFEELGRACVPGPLIGTWLAAGRGGDDGVPPDVADLAARAAAGEAVVGVVPAGDPAFVEHLAGLDALLVVADRGVTLVDPPASSRPVDRSLDPLSPVDLVERLPGGTTLGGPDVAAGARSAGAVVAAALQVGLADAAVAMGTAYAKERTQFGRVIGSFQAVKHMLADAQVQIEVARAAVQAAGVEVDDALQAQQAEPLTDVDRVRVHRAEDAARIVASHAADRATRACVQVHGGMGFTWELDAHLYLKRALVLDVGIATPEAAAESLAATL